MSFNFDTDCEELKKWMENWKEEHNIPENAALTQEQTIEFMTELYSKMDEFGYYDLSEGANIIPYSRSAIDGTAAWKIAEGISINSSNLYYISDSTAGKLINSSGFIKCLTRAAIARAAIAFLPEPEMTPYLAEPGTMFWTAGKEMISSTAEPGMIPTYSAGITGRMSSATRAESQRSESKILPYPSLQSYRRERRLS